MSAESLDKELFKGKTLGGLFKDIYNNSKNKEKQLNQLIQELQPLVKTLGDATVIIPHIKDFMEVGVRNDELLVKMAAIAQRSLEDKQNTVSAGSGLISQEELDELEKNISENTKKLTIALEKDDELMKKATDKFNSIVSSSIDIKKTI